MQKFHVVLLIIILFALCCSCAGLKHTEDISMSDSNEILFTFCAMSDVHMGGTKSEDKFNRAMAYLSGLDIPPEVYLVAGDMTNTTGISNNNEQIRQFETIYSKFAEPEQLFYCLGPHHDIPQTTASQDGRALFRDTFGEEYFVNDLQSEQIMMDYGIRYMQVKGYNFFSIDWNGTTGGELSPKGQTWLREKLQTATKKDSNKPIFVITHVPGKSSIDGILKDFPQVICFTGHSHNSVAREDSISQDKQYTWIHCGGMNYYRVNGYERVDSNPFLKLGDIYAFGQAIYVQVCKNNNVIITRMDVYNGVPLQDKWIVGPTRRTVYTSNRANTAKKCMFEVDDVLRVREIESKKQLRISWDACASGEGGAPLYYRVQLLKNSGNGKYFVVDHAELGSQQVFYPNDEGIPALYYSYTFSKVDCFEDYAVMVTAVDCWNSSGNALVYTNGVYQSKIPQSGTVQHEKLN